MRKHRSIAARFWEKVDKDGPLVDGMKTRCWVWTASLAEGYGQIAIPGGVGPILAHRLSWIMTNGPIPNGMCALHRCDNRPCVRPGHLFLGTRRDNMLDMIKKGRSDYIGAEGSRNHRSKLTEDRVRRMRQLNKKNPKKWSVPYFVREYELANATVWAAMTGRSWAHV